MSGRERQPDRNWSDQDRWQSQGERGRGRGSYFPQPSHELAHFTMTERERQPDRNWNDQDAGRMRGSYYPRSSNERAHSSQSPFSRGQIRNEIDSRYGRNGGNGEARDRAMPSSDQYASSRSSSRDTYYRGSTNFRNGEYSRRQERDQPMGFNGNRRRYRSREGHSASDDRTKYRRVENGASSSYRVQPMEFENVCVGSSSSNGASNQQYEAASNNRREAAALERMALAKSTGLVPGNHVITPITRQVASKQGTSGTKVNLVANYFRVTERSTWQLYLYRVDFSPPIENKIFQGGLLHGQIKDYGRYLFDGTMLYMLAKFEQDLTEFHTKGKKDDQPYIIKIKLVGLVPRNTYQYLHVWSTLLRKCERYLGLQLVGRNYYDPNQKKEIPRYRLSLWPGFVTAIHQHERHILLNVDTSTKVMRTDTVYDIMQGCRRDTEKIKNKVLGMTVRTTYNNKTYRISDIDFTQNPTDKFNLKTGKEISFVDYYMNKHQKNIQDLRQPLLIVRSSQRQRRAGQPDTFSLIPELCFATGFDNDMRKDNGLMKAVADFTRLDPAQRIRRSQAHIKSLHNCEKIEEIFRDWDFKVDANPTELIGRELTSAEVGFGENKTMQTTDWSKHFRNNKMYGSQPLSNWVLIYPQATNTATQKFVGTLQRVANGMDYSIDMPHLRPLRTDDSSAYMEELTQVRNRDPQLIVCVLSHSSEELYGRIKKYCIDNAIPSQILLLKTIVGQSVMSVATKVVIQINSKLGGAPWTVKMSLTGLMTIGFDVSHNTKDRRKKSCGAIVATWDGMDKISKKCYSAVSDHISGSLLSEDIALQVCQAVREYLKDMKALPKHILFYRGGVGEGQIPYVKEVEIQNIMDKLGQWYGDAEVPLTFIVVTKQINTRFFVKCGRECANPKLGTVVDDVITMPEKQEFLLVSSFVRQGTVSPTSYNVLVNNMGLSSDKLQRLTYKMTYLYYNWCSTISVPAVCQYAHKLAFLVGNFGLTPPSNDLQRRLYFL